jgi:hypothetical protein
MSHGFIVGRFLKKRSGWNGPRRSILPSEAESGCLNHIRNLFRALSPALFSCGGSEQGRPLDSNRFQCKGCGKPFPSGRADERRLIRPLSGIRGPHGLVPFFALCDNNLASQRG